MRNAEPAGLAEGQGCMHGAEAVQKLGVLFPTTVQGRARVYCLGRIAHRGEEGGGHTPAQAKENTSEIF